MLWVDICETDQVLLIEAGIDHGFLRHLGKCHSRNAFAGFWILSVFWCICGFGDKIHKFALFFDIVVGALAQLELRLLEPFVAG